jgi:hypothetical protein
MCVLVLTIRYFASQNRGVLFFELVSPRRDSHAVIECIPVPAEVYEQAPAYLKEAILSTSNEWAQHRKIIDTSANGIRKSLIAKLPYFHGINLLL